MKDIQFKPNNYQAILNGGKAYITRSTKAYITKENTRCDQFFTGTKRLQTQLFNEFKSRIESNATSAPHFIGPYAYYTHYKKNAEYPVYYRTKRNEQKKEIVLDTTKLAENKDFFQLMGSTITTDHTIIAYAMDTKGAEQGSLYYQTIGQKETHKICENASGSMVCKGTILYFVTLNAQNHPDTVKAYDINKRIVYTVYVEKDPRFFVSLGETANEEYVFILLHGSDQSEVWISHKFWPVSKFTLALPRKDKVEYAQFEHRNGLFYVLTNAQDKNFQILTGTLSTPLHKWQVFAETTKENQLLEDMDVHSTFLVYTLLNKAKPEIHLHQFEKNKENVITHDEPCYDLYLGNHFDYDDSSFSYGINSPKTPNTLWQYSINTKEKTVFKAPTVPNFNSTHYDTKWIYVRTYDNTEIPVSLLYAKNHNLAKPSPVLLYGYGAYGLSLSDGFSSPIFSLIDRGVIFAKAHIRGGMEMGYDWYLQGKQFYKHNTFLDFITVAQYLIEQGITSPKQLVGMGGSAGGMLMGYLANNTPDLFAALVALVPFVDCLETMLDETLPLTPPEWSEWGNPITNPVAYAYIKAYAPTENVTHGVHPSIYATCGLSDPRVGFWEVLKWVYKLQQTQTKKKNPILLRTLIEGHMGKSGRYQSLHELTEIYTFILKSVELV